MAAAAVFVSTTSTNAFSMNHHHHNSHCGSSCITKRPSSSVSLPLSLLLNDERNSLSIPFVLSTASSSQHKYTTTSRLYSSFRKRNDDDDNEDNGNLKYNNSNNKKQEDNSSNGGIVNKALTFSKNVVKTFLPSSWFQSEQEKKAAIQRQRVKNEISSTFNEILKDAPLPIRMIGKSIISPLITNVMSGLAETLSEQQSTNQQLLVQAELYLQNDISIQRIIGNSAIIQAGTPFSQSSSTSSINGRTTSRIELLFPVLTSVSTKSAIGTCRLIGSNGQIDQLDFTSDNGRTISINTMLSATTSSSQQQQIYSSSKNDFINGDDNIIEAEIIEKIKK